MEVGGKYTVTCSRLTSQMEIIHREKKRNEEPLLLFSLAPDRAFKLFSRLWHLGGKPTEVMAHWNHIDRWLFSMHCVALLGPCSYASSVFLYGRPAVTGPAPLQCNDSIIKRK